MSANQFGKLSKILLRAKAEDGKTFLEDVYFTAPFKIMRPFPRENGGIRVMQMAASAGIMEGDCQELEFDIGTGADLEFVSQSYDKIHEMKEGCARRTTKIRVHSGAAFCFHPQPTIPFKDSAFESRMEIHLDDETSVFSMSEILSCGRYAREERFAYRHYYNLVEIHRGEALIYRDNTRYIPSMFDMEGLGMYENFTHLSNIFISRPKDPEAYKRKIQERLDRKADVEGSVTMLFGGDLAVRIFGRRAQDLERVNKEIFGTEH